MKRIVSISCFLLICIATFPQSHYDYMDDSAVAGGADRVLNTFVIIFFVVLVLLIIIFVFGGIAKIKYELSPQSEIDRQKKAKEEQEKQEKVRREQERQKALLALPENTIRLLVEGRPHLVELARMGNRIHTEMVAICLWSVDNIIWDGTDITDKVGSVEKPINHIYGDYYESRYDCSAVRNMGELVVSKQCADLADKTSNRTFEIELTIRGDFNPSKLQIIHHTHEGLRHHNVSRDIKCLEFVLYGGDIIQAHLTNGKPFCFPYEGYVVKYPE